MIRKTIIRDKSDTSTRDPFDASDPEVETPLHLAVHDGNLETVQHLVDIGADMEAQDSEGSTPLSIALRRGDRWNVVEYLMDRGAETLGYTLLHYAAAEGNTEMLQVYLEKKPEDIRAKNIYGETPLHAAVMRGTLGTVKGLVNSGADIEARDSEGLTPLQLLHREEGDWNVVEFLMERGAKSNGDTILHLAAGYGQADKIRKYFEQKPGDIRAKNNNGQTPLHLAVNYGTLETVQCLVDSGADMEEQDSNYQTSLLLALNRKDGWNVVEFLLARGAESEGNTLLHFAAGEGNTDMVQYYLDQNPDYLHTKNIYHETPLHRAVGHAFYGALEIVQHLVDIGAGMEARNLEGFTPLSVALNYLHRENGWNVVKYLLESGAESDGYTLLHFAAERGNANKMLQVFLEQKPGDVNKKNNYGETPLHLAIEFGTLQTVMCLVNSGADIEEQDSQGRTSLQLARIREEDWPVAEFLLEHGAKSEGNTLNRNVKENDAAPSAKKQRVSRR